MVKNRLQFFTRFYNYPRVLWKKQKVKYILMLQLLRQFQGLFSITTHFNSVTPVSDLAQKHPSTDPRSGVQGFYKGAVVGLQQ